VEWMREAIGRGHHVGPDDAVVAIGDALLRSTATGADRSAAVLALESLKAVTTASSLATGFPIGPGAADEGAFAPRIQDAHRRREALRLRHMWSPDTPGLDEQLGAHTAELAGLRQQQSLRDARFAAWVDASDVGLSGLDWIRPRLLSLGPRTRLLGTFAGPDATWTYLVGPDGTRLTSRPGAGAPHAGRFDEAALAALADTLLSPFVDEIEGMQPDDRLLVSPDFGYFDAPLAALPLRGKRLCERVTLSLVQGTGVLEAVLGRRREHRRVLALGGPRRPDRDDLPGALAEARHIAELFGPAGTSLLGRQATVPALVEALRERDVLHLACHADAAGEAEPLARLLLAPDVRGNDSGVLSEDRVVAELALAEGAFVNLAGCATARQQRSSGPLMGGLVPAFLVAGAGSVLCTVHPLADGAATRFQEAFYRHLIAGRSPAQSLAAAQRDCLRGELGPGMRQVQAWAFYVIYGVG
jgi:hypothetical protein